MEIGVNPVCAGVSLHCDAKLNAELLQIATPLGTREFRSGTGHVGSGVECCFPMAQNSIPYSDTSTMSARTLAIAVIMQRTALDNRWVSEKWEALGVVQDVQGPAGPRVILDDGKFRRVLYTGFSLELFRDEAESYHLNLTSPEPRVFVLLRGEDGPPAPAMATVSYAEAARWMDGGENVDGVPMPPDIYAWVGEFVEAHYVPKPTKKRQRT